MRTPVVIAAVTCTLSVLGGCGSAEKTSSASQVKVAGDNDSCTPSTTELRSGRTTFAFTNTADKVSELYVLTEDGGVVAEVENVTTGSTRKLTATLGAGTYTLQCKPGQTGDGFSSTITVSGSTTQTTEAASKEIDFTARDHTFEDLDTTGITAGTTVRFVMHNAGTVQHEFEVFGPDGAVLGEIGPTDPGKDGSVTLALNQPGVYRFTCGITDHEAKGMTGTFTLSSAK